MTPQQLLAWLRPRGVLTVSVGSRVQLTLTLRNDDVITTEPQDSFELAAEQLMQRTRLYEEVKEAEREAAGR